MDIINISKIISESFDVVVIQEFGKISSMVCLEFKLYMININRFCLLLLNLTFDGVYFTLISEEEGGCLRALTIPLDAPENS